MGLSASINTQYGAPATYWVVSQITIDNVGNRILAIMDGYMTQAAHDAGSSPVAQQNIRVNMFILTGIAPNQIYTLNPQYQAIMADAPGEGIIDQVQAAFVANIEQLNGAQIVTDTAPIAPQVG
jgi:hypothetical protein